MATDAADATSTENLVFCSETNMQLGRLSSMACHLYLNIAPSRGNKRRGIPLD